MLERIPAIGANHSPCALIRSELAFEFDGDRKPCPVHLATGLEHRAKPRLGAFDEQLEGAKRFNASRFLALDDVVGARKLLDVLENLFPVGK